MLSWIRMAKSSKYNEWFPNRKWSYNGLLDTYSYIRLSRSVTITGLIAKPRATASEVISLSWETHYLKQKSLPTIVLWQLLSMFFIISLTLCKLLMILNKSTRISGSVNSPAWFTTILVITSWDFLMFY